MTEFILGWIGSIEGPMNVVYFPFCSYMLVLWCSKGQFCKKNVLINIRGHLNHKLFNSGRHLVSFLDQISFSHTL